MRACQTLRTHARAHAPCLMPAAPVCCCSPPISPLAMLCVQQRQRTGAHAGLRTDRCMLRAHGATGVLLMVAQQQRRLQSGRVSTLARRAMRTLACKRVPTHARTLMPADFGQQRPEGIIVSAWLIAVLLLRAWVGRGAGACARAYTCRALVRSMAPSLSPPQD